MAGGRRSKPAEPDHDRKVGLLPPDNRRQLDGVTSYVFRSTSTDRRQRVIPAHQVNVPIKTTIRQRAREDRHLIKRLKIDKGYTLGAKYLAKSNRLPLEDDEDEDEEPVTKVGSNHRIFSAATIRAIGYDPTRTEFGLLHDAEDEVTKERRVSL